MGHDFLQIWIMRKNNYFFKLILDGLSDFHQIWLRSSLNNDGKKLWNSSWVVKQHLNHITSHLKIAYSSHIDIEYEKNEADAVKVLD